MFVDLGAVGESVTVGVGVEDAGAGLSLGAVGDSVRVGVGAGGVGARGGLVDVADTILVGIAGAQDIETSVEGLVAVIEPVAVRVGALGQPVGVDVVVQAGVEIDRSGGEVDACQVAPGAGTRES